MRRCLLGAFPFTMIVLRGLPNVCSDNKMPCQNILCSLPWVDIGKNSSGFDLTFLGSVLMNKMVAFLWSEHNSKFLTEVLYCSHQSQPKTCGRWTALLNEFQHYQTSILIAAWSGLWGDKLMKAYIDSFSCLRQGADQMPQLFWHCKISALQWMFISCISYYWCINQQRP